MDGYVNVTVIINFSWRLGEEDSPTAYPYVEFQKSLPLIINPISAASVQKTI